MMSLYELEQMLLMLDREANQAELRARQILLVRNEPVEPRRSLRHAIATRFIAAGIRIDPLTPEATALRMRRLAAAPAR